MVNKDGSYQKRVEKIDIAERVNIQTTVPNLKVAKDSSIVNSKYPTTRDLNSNAQKVAKSTTVIKKK
jgi:hypothetical protein